MALPSSTLKKLLLESSVVEEKEFPELEKEAKRTGISIERLLISKGRLTEQYLNQLVSKFLGIQIVDFRSEPLDTSIVELLPEAVARQHEAIVFGKDEKTGGYKVALADPTNVDTLNFLHEYLKGDVQPFIASKGALRLGYQVYKRKSAGEFEKVIDEKVGQLVGTLREAKSSNILESVPLTQLFDNFLDYAATLNASDVYFQPDEDMLLIRFRVDGVVRDITTIDKRVHDGLIARAKILSGIRIDEHMKPQDGRFKFKSSNFDIDVRTAIMPTFHGEKITMRLLPGTKEFVSFEELGIPDDTSTRLRAEVAKPYGMILSSGPTGSGKTTTIYAILNLLNRPEVNITTIEDPVEYVMPRISQTQVNPIAGITFASGLRSLMRHSPDTIVVGEIRDGETAEIAIHASLTGHLLISTIHTNNAIGAIPRLIDLGVPAFFVSATLNAVLAQRLVRRICQQCIRSRELTKVDIQTIESEFKKRGVTREVSKTVYHGAGCSACGMTGYTGRVGIYEIFILDQYARELINAGKYSTDDLTKAADVQKMRTMFEDGIYKAEQGVTTIEEVFRAIRE